ncbi:hypothetical protein [Maridesulfovibrio sp.]|uniref:hypothetical protein n=1 Tax=Maridesulfovibrio sp. TaxID=2795000 RepID=UPI002A18D227|nr:hypothetical protein [Maridesulfovibrio sp.]
MRDSVDRVYENLPFGTELSFAPLYRKARDIYERSENYYGREVGRILESMEKPGGLLDSFSEDDPGIFADEIRFLMGFVFPELDDGNVLCRAMRPFTRKHFFSSARYRELFEDRGGELVLSESLEMQILTDLAGENLLFAYTMLFDIYYDLDHEMMEAVMKMVDPGSSIDRYFLTEYSFRFVEVDAAGLEILPREQFSRLLIMRDRKTLEKLMPLDGLVFRGIITVRYVEVTEKENISRLKSDLMNSGALRNPQAVESVAHRLGSILRVEDLRAGFFFRYRVVEGNTDCTLRSVFREYPGDVSELLDFVYGQLLDTGEAYFVPEVLECGDEGVGTFLHDSGIRSIGLIPLKENGEVIAVLELASGSSEMISSSGVRKISELLPGLSVAVRREMNYLESRVDSVIKEFCTAIHPSVAWRFEEAAFRYLNRLEKDGSADFENIVFKDIYPLYGSMDIRSSSEQRNLAIQNDLLEQLELASETLEDIYKNRSIPIADYFISTLGRFRDKVASGLDSGDEISVIEFLQQRVEPFFRYLRDNSEAHSARIDEYFEMMSPGMGIIYRQRRDYEESVSMLNTVLSEFLEDAERKAQDIFPHYFEKYRTDGVEYNIYIGRAMTEKFHFEDVQLKNLRIWQLTKMCEMSRLTESMLDQMKIPLSCAPLILVHSAPLTIQFRVDEKRFEVEGTYNIRYEIIKKRIDKSTILGTGERLTQPGKLAVIYTQDREWREYLSYFEYLADKGYVSGEVEHLILEDLQGVHGLRALRVDLLPAT